MRERKLLAAQRSSAPVRSGKATPLSTAFGRIRAPPASIRGLGLKMCRSCRTQRDCMADTRDILPTPGTAACLLQSRSSHLIARKAKANLACLSWRRSRCGQGDQSSRCARSGAKNGMAAGVCHRWRSHRRIVCSTCKRGAASVMCFNTATRRFPRPASVLTSSLRHRHNELVCAAWVNESARFHLR